MYLQLLILSTDIAAGWVGSNIGGQYQKLLIQSSAPDDGRKHRPKHVELIRNKQINKSKWLHLVGHQLQLH